MRKSSTPNSETPAPPGVDRITGDVRRIRSDELLGSGREIIIDHDGRAYRLRITQNGKLILTA